MLSSHGLWDGSIFSYGSPGRLVFRQPWRAGRGGCHPPEGYFLSVQKVPISGLRAAAFAAVGLRNTSLRLGENTLRGRRPACSSAPAQGAGMRPAGPNFSFRCWKGPPSGEADFIRPSGRVRRVPTLRGVTFCSCKKSPKTRLGAAPLKTPVFGSGSWSVLFCRRIGRTSTYDLWHLSKYASRPVKR